MPIYPAMWYAPAYGIQYHRFLMGWALVESEKKAFYIDHSMHIVFTFEECDTLLH